MNPDTLTWHKTKDALPTYGQLVWIRGPQLNPIKARRVKPKEDFAPCWQPTEEKRSGVMEWADGIEEWAMIKKEGV